MQQVLWDFETQMDPTNPDQKTRPYVNSKEEKNLSSCRFCLFGERSNENKCKQKNKFLDLELKTLLNIRMTLISVVVNALRTFPKDFGGKKQEILEIRGRILIC